MKKLYDSKRNYIKGSAKARSGGDFEFINVDLLLSDLQNLPVNDSGYVKLTLSKMKQPDKFGNTHSIFENDFKPDPKKAGGSNFSAAKKQKSTDDMPF